MKRYPRATASPGGPLHSTITLGRVRGIELGIHWTWLIVFGLIAWSLAASVFPDAEAGLSDGEYWALGVGATALFFASLLLHELGHAVVAQREGMAIDGITLWLFGGVARFRGMFPSAGAEFRIAVAGPLVTLVIASLCISVSEVPGTPVGVELLSGWLGGVSIALLVFNLLPALPLDGGRVLRSALWAHSGDFSTATRRAGGLGEFFGRFLIFGGLAMVFLGGPGGLWLALIGWFVLSAAQAEMAIGVAYELLAGLTAADAMVAEPVSAPAGLSVQEFLEDPFASTHYAAYPVVDDGETIGIVAVGDVLAVPADQRYERTVGDVMVPRSGAVSVDVGTPLAEAATHLVGTSLGRGLVTDGDAVVGLVSLTDIAHEVESRERHANTDRVSVRY